MFPTKLPICAAALVLMATGSAFADPAYVPSTVNLRDGAGTGKPILAKIPGGSRLEATNCSDWCEVEWQGKKGFVIANALDRSGKAPVSQPASKSASDPRTTGSVTRRPPRRPKVYVEEDDYVPMGPPVVYGGPYYYPYRPYVYAYRPYYYGYRRGYRRW
jgi:uncharacterized protein YraI